MAVLLEVGLDARRYAGDGQEVVALVRVTDEASGEEA
jgi:hypothetical protein